jgi:hypothetical protein
MVICTVQMSSTRVRVPIPVCVCFRIPSRVLFPVPILARLCVYIRVIVFSQVALAIFLG